MTYQMLVFLVGVYCGGVLSTAYTIYLSDETLFDWYNLVIVLLWPLVVLMTILMKASEEDPNA